MNKSPSKFYQQKFLDQFKHANVFLTFNRESADALNDLIVRHNNKDQYIAIALKDDSENEDIEQALDYDWESLYQRNIIIFPSNDKEGFDSASEIYDKLNSISSSVIIKDLYYLNEENKSYNDIGDYIYNTKPTLEELLAIPNLDLPNDFLTFNEKSKDCWPDILPIKSQMLPVQDLSLDLLPPPLRPWIADIAFRMQCPIDFVAVSAIVSISSIIGASCAVRPKRLDNWEVIPNLWGIIIGDPSTLKTPAVKESLKPLTALESRAKIKYEEETKAYLQDFEIYKLEKDKILKEHAKSKIANCIELTSSKLQSIEEPKKPLLKRYKTNDATVEKIGDLLSQNDRGILVFRDELMGLFASWNKKENASDRSFYLEGWNGDGKYTIDRIGRGTIYIEHHCISILGCTQPSKIVNYLSKAALEENDGLMQRFQLLIYPNNKEWKLIDQAPDKEAEKIASFIIHEVASIDFLKNGAQQDNEYGIPYYRFNQDAQELFNKWVTGLEKKIRANEKSILTEHLNKYRSLMPSLALIFHLIDVTSLKLKQKDSLDSVNDYQLNEISASATNCAILWCDYLESHATRVYNLRLDEPKQALDALLKRITSGELSEPFSVRDIYRKGWRLLTDVHVINTACDELCNSNHLRKVLTPSSYQQKGTTLFFINPILIGD